MSQHDAPSSSDDAAHKRGTGVDRTLVVWSATIARLLVVYGVYAVLRREPIGYDTILVLLMAVLASFVVLVLVLVALVWARTWRTVGKVALAAVVGIGAAVVAEWKSEDIHWARSSAAFTRAADEGRLPCGKDACRLGHWTGTKVVVLESATLVFVRDASDECYAGRAFLRPARPGIAADELHAFAYSVTRSSPTSVRPANDGWWHVCARS